MKKDYPKEIIRPMRHEQVLFKDGMIVTADDLQAAMQYPLGVFQTLIRAFFGCGIVCGLKVEWLPGSTTCDYDDKKKNVWCVKIHPGVALDCEGFPLELCQPIQIDLTPDPCRCDDPPSCVCIAIRRYIEEEPQPKSQGKGCESEQGHDCSRKREQVMIKVFEIDKAKGLKLPENICMRTLDAAKPIDETGEYEKPNREKDDSKTLNAFCDCLKACPDHHCCGEGWVLLACIKLGACGIECIDHRRRKYIKPIDCLCPAEEKECLDQQDEADKAKEESYKKPGSEAPAAQSAGKQRAGGRKR
jgi:hypothetical protein